MTVDELPHSGTPGSQLAGQLPGAFRGPATPFIGLPRRGIPRAPYSLDRPSTASLLSPPHASTLDWMLPIRDALTQGDKCAHHTGALTTHSEALNRHLSPLPQESSRRRSGERPFDSLLPCACSLLLLRCFPAHRPVASGRAVKADAVSAQRSAGPSRLVAGAACSMLHRSGYPATGLPSASRPFGLSAGSARPVARLGGAEEIRTPDSLRAKQVLSL